jgi:hypothetical protein
VFSRLISAIPFKHRHQLVVPIILSVALVFPAVTQAQWDIAPSIGAGYQYDDNPILIGDTTLGDSVNGYLLEADAEILYNSQLTEFSLTPRVLVSRYDEISELDSEDYFVDLDYLYTGQRSRFRVRGYYGDESTRTAERSGVDFNVDDPADIPDDNSGRVLNTENRQRIQLRPFWSYKMGQRSVLRIGANYLDVSYDENIFQFNSDYDQTRATAGADFNYSERSAFTIDGYYRENYFARDDRNYSGYGATVGINRSLTEQSRFIFNVGMDSSEDAAGEKQNNTIGGISYIRNMETSRFLASYRRAITGSGSGVLSVRDSININLTRNLSEKFLISAGVSAYQTEAVDTDTVGDFDERDYIQFRALFGWNLTRVFAIELDYSYTNIDRASLPSDADSNQINLWFRYRALR